MSAVIIASTAAVIASNGARRANCQRVIDGYESATASIEQAQAYANCVLFLHPEAMSSATTLMLKALVLSVFIGFAFGFWKSKWFLWGDDLLTKLLAGALGAISVPTAGIVCFSAWIVVRFVLGVA